MKLLTHNFLSSRFLKGAAQGYPLKLVVNEKNVLPNEYNADLVSALMGRIDYEALLLAAEASGEAGKLPKVLPDKSNWNDEFLEEVHRLLYCIDVIDGVLTCPDTGREFPIKDGIPNMLCSEEEAA
ncbi:unnamed protein product [Auanema sp. JU1783]|nr:unnamed protein product [Auanema sp. JU1783]